ncbi:MAG: dipeptide epimerase [Planctomycetota bacterium]|jgi:L-alanine-DL-glutamate epimerase-like enolase superfamily enzyme
MKLTLHRFDLPTRHPFTISRGTTTVQPTLIVELEQDGVCGYGEAPECAYYGATIGNMTAALERVRPQIEAADLEDPIDLWEATGRLLRGDEPRNSPSPATFPQCALDIAAHDLWGKLRGAPVWKLWGLDLENLPPSDYTIGIDSIDVMIEKLKEFSGWPVYKIKLGTPQDLNIVRSLREQTDAVFRVDANCAWTARETIRNAAALKELGVEFIEQPLPPEDWAGMKSVYRGSVLPVVADESCQVEADVDRCAGHFHGINIKLHKCGGLTPARRMIARARELDMKVMVGCFTESSVGISAIAQLLPLLDYVDMDGALLLAEDVATGVTIDRGRVKYADENGCGVRLLSHRTATGGRD